MTESTTPVVTLPSPEKTSQEKITAEKIALALEITHSRPLTACHWNTCGRYVFFGAEDNIVHRYDTVSGKSVDLVAHDSWVRAFGSAIDGQMLYSGGYDGRLVFWPITAEQPQPVRVVDAHAGWIRAIAVSPSGRWVASCGNDRLVKLWNASTGDLVRQFAGHMSHVYNVLFAHDESKLYSCDLKGTVWTWPLSAEARPLSAEEGREWVTVKALHDYDTTFRADIGGARGVALRRDGKQFALSGIVNVSNAFAGVGDVAVALLNVETGGIDQLLETKDKTKGTAWGVAHHGGDFWVAVSGGGGGGWLYFWRGDTSQEFFKLALKNDGRGMSMSPDQSQLAVAHADGVLRIYRFG